MKRIFPSEKNLDPIDFYDRIRNSHTGRPWLLLNMITSIDGSTHISGTSGGLGGPADQEVLGTLRSFADVILVGSGTVRAENYNIPYIPGNEAGKRRVERGQSPRPRLAVVSGSGNLDPKIPMFDQNKIEDVKPLIYTTENGNGNLSTDFESRAEIVASNGSQVDLSFVLEDLFDRGVSVVLAEGGPSLNHQLIEAQLVDELCLTISPRLIGGESEGILNGPLLSHPHKFQLNGLATQDEFLFCSYLLKQDLNCS